MLNSHTEGTTWWVFEYKVLRRIFSSKKDEVKGIEDTFKMRRFTTCTLHLTSLRLLHQGGSTCNKNGGKQEVNTTSRKDTIWNFCTIRKGDVKT
jgi:hypothetical protein